MAKSKKLSRSIDLPIARVYEVVSSERYLLTTEEMDKADSLEIVDAHREVREDGSMTAAVISNYILGEGAEKVESVHLSHLSVPAEDGSFELRTELPMPQGMAVVTSDFSFSPAEGSGDSSEGATSVEVEISVETKLPLLGAKLAKHLLNTADDGVDSGLGRVRRLAASTD